MSRRELGELRSVSDKERLHKQRLRLFLDHHGEGSGEFLRSGDEQRLQAHAHGVGGSLRLIEEGARVGIVAGAEKGDPGETRQKFPAQLQPLARQIGRVGRDSGEVPPPGRERLATSPVAYGFETDMPIGMVAVAFLAAWAAGVAEATIMSTSRRTRSAASAAARSLRCSAEWYSTWMLTPST